MPDPLSVVALLPGRFQPFHAGHYAAWRALADAFGEDRAFIGTSDKVELPRSPLGFAEKRAVMTGLFDVPEAQVVQLRSPYRPAELLERFPSASTALVVALSQKDAERLTRGRYYRPWTGQAAEPFGEAGYVQVVPVAAGGVSGTRVRDLLADPDLDEAARVQGFKELYPRFDPVIYEMLRARMGDMLR
ncbi:MAG: hypothetical protein H6739_00375 [Alphaproteobacteria bacterium]|nr:hypothetical protein [Alphaproteobacteria bacterium]